MASLHHRSEKMKPHLSVVVTSRNDNHGGQLLYRMQHFVNGLIEQCDRHQLAAELIIVEWNPPEENPPLAQALKFPKQNGYCSIRIIKIPNEIHRRFKHSEKIPLYQMIGKNVGIRRALGEFILATNIDILFSDGLIRYIKKKLRPGRSYRVDRLDVSSEFPQNSSFDEILEFCSKNVLRTCSRFGDEDPNEKKLKGKWRETLFKKPLKDGLSRGFKRLKRHIRYPHHTIVRIPVCRFLLKRLLKKFSPIHTNACGDFTLLSLVDWINLRGYPEWHIFSWHLDGILLYQAKQHGIKEVDLAKVIYHIDHKGGYSPEEGQELFHRLDAKGTPYINSSSLERILSDIEKSKEKVLYNDENWGLFNQDLEEITIRSCLEVK